MGYRGEIRAKLIADPKDFKYQVGERALQLVIIPIPKVELKVVEELSDSDRGEGGFGSTN